MSTKGDDAISQEVLDGILARALAAPPNPELKRTFSESVVCREWPDQALLDCLGDR